MIRRLTFLLLLLFPATATFLHAQRSDDVLSDKEVDELRESAYFANDRVLVFIKLIDTRVDSIRDLYAHTRRPGREQDTHDLLEQFTALADELSDNLDEYTENHRDIRKALPKLIENTERWATAIKSPPDDSAYNVSRNLALESIRDLREDATHTLDEQRAWFKAHPPAKSDSSIAGDAPR